MAKKRSIDKPEKSGQKLPELIYESCRTLAFTCIEPPAGIRDIAYSWRIDIDADIPDQVITVRVSIDGVRPPGSTERKQGNNGGDDILFSIITVNRFQGKNLADEIKVTDNRIELPAWMMATLASTAIGTTRGVLVTKLAGTMYSDSTLPIFNLRTLIPDMELMEIPLHGI